MSKPEQAVTLLGAGLAGSLAALFLARQGYRVEVYEQRPDLRREDAPAGRSINLALAERGIRPLQRAGVYRELAELLIPMRGRLIHELDGTTRLLPYGQREGEQIYSVGRGGLNGLLMDHAESHGARFHFRQQCTGFDPESATLYMRDVAAGRDYGLAYRTLIAADGGGSPIRRDLASRADYTASEDLLDHSYKELTIPALDGKHRIERNALHIWPRGGYMLIALPNPDGTFTVTLFLPNEGHPGFASLDTPDAVTDFFASEFADALALIPALERDFFENPTGWLGTVRCWPWRYRDQVILLGDAAHAVVPFHGQGMNCAFEDCALLDRLAGEYPGDWNHILSALETERKPNADAIADMALENYVEMRDTVRAPGFQLEKELAFELERRLPEHFIPRYSMVMFHDEIPYAEARRRGIIQAEILEAMTAGAQVLGDIDIRAAEDLVRARLAPIAKPAGRDRP